MRTLMIFCTAILLLGTATAADRLKLPVPSATKAAGLNEDLPGADIEALALIVMMEAAKSAQEDVRAVMAGVKAINQSKQALREQLQDEQKLRADPCSGKTVVNLRDCFKRLRASTARMELAALDLSKAALLDARDKSQRMLQSMQGVKRKRGPLVRSAFGGASKPCGVPSVVAWKSCLDLVETQAVLQAPDEVSRRTLENAIAEMKDEVDQMSEQGELESLRLQMAMDRMSKMMSTLSNILKKISDTSSQITQNLK